MYKGVKNIHVCDVTALQGKSLMKDISTEIHPQCREMFPTNSQWCKRNALSMRI